MSEKKKEIISKSAEVAGVLVDKLSGILPAVAEAKVEAEEITLRGMIKNEGIARRAGFRILRQQGNIEDIAHLAGEKMQPGSEHQARDMDEDWAADFSEKCKNTSDKEMQALWASILAGEADRPGSFSKSTVAIVGMMDKNDARMFSDFCQFVWGLIIDEADGEREEGVLLIYDRKEGVAQNQSFSILAAARHLDYLRLISFWPSTGNYTRAFPFPFYSWDYHGARVHLSAPQERHGEHKDNFVVDTGRAVFTEAGEELYRICGAQKDDDAFQYVLGKWQELGYNPCTVLPDADKKGRE